jgi:SOS-response transcriptional repressor LexA
MMGLNPRQRECLIFIRAHVKAHGVSPTYREIMTAVGWHSKTSVLTALYHLEVAGAVRCWPRRANGIELLQTKDYHLPGCNCDACAQGRYIAQLKLIQGLKVDPPAAVTNARLVGIRLLSQETRAALLGEPVNAAPRTRTALPQGGR